MTQNTDAKPTSRYPLRLSPEIRAQAKQYADKSDMSLNNFIEIAVTEKVATLRTMEFFKERAERADREAFRAFLKREDGEPPRKGDEIPVEKE